MGLADLFVLGRRACSVLASAAATESAAAAARQRLEGGGWARGGVRSFSSTAAAMAPIKVTVGPFPHLLRSYPSPPPGVSPSLLPFAPAPRFLEDPPAVYPSHPLCKTPRLPRRFFQLGTLIQSPEPSPGNPSHPLCDTQ